MATTGKVLFGIGIALGALGLLVLILFYASLGALPIAALESWNLIIGLCLVLAGVLPFVVGVILWVLSRPRNNKLTNRRAVP